MRLSLARIAISLVALSCANARGEEAPPLQFASLGVCKLESGQAIEDCKLGYRTLGSLNARRDNVVLVPTYFSGKSQDLVAIIQSGLIDTHQFFVIVMDAFGNGVSSSPSNSQSQPRLQFPQFTIADMVNAQHRMMADVLHISHLHAVLGLSMGGMQAFQWAVSYPMFADCIVPVVGSPRLTSVDLLLWTAEANAITESAGWNRGKYQGRPEMRALSDIHYLALTTPAYRIEHTQRSAFAEFLANTESTATNGMDPTDWLYQLRAMMAHDLAKPFAGDMGKAAGVVKSKILIVVATEDHMVNPEPSIEFAHLLKVQPMLLEGSCGHMAPMCHDTELFAEIAAFLEPSLSETPGGMSP